MRSLTCLFLLVLSSTAVAQVPTAFFNVGAGQTAIDPIMPPASGTLALGGLYCGAASAGSTPTMDFTLTGLTSGWVTNPNENVYLLVAFGAASTPPTTILQGDFLIPLGGAGPVTIAGPLPVLYTGPLGIVCPPPVIPAVGAPRATGLGLRAFVSIPPTAAGVTISFQAVLADGIRLYTSNAITAAF